MKEEIKKDRRMRKEIKEDRWMKEEMKRDQLKMDEIMEDSLMGEDGGEKKGKPILRQISGNSQTDRLK